MVIRKPSQVGATEFNLSTALWAADSQYAGRGMVIYIMPTDEMAGRTSQVRLNRAVQESAYLRQRAVPEPGIARSPASFQRRAIGPGVIYFCGSERETQYSGIDADIVILDEYDLMKEEVISLAQSRLRSSRAPRLRVSSTPTISDFGVSQLYEVSDQRHYELLCGECGTWQEPSFPDSVDWDTTTVVCCDCRIPLDPWGAGRWVAHRPDESEIRGYQLNRLTLPNPPLLDMKVALDGKIPTSRETFYRQDLGQPFTSPESRLTPEILDSCVQSWVPQVPLRMNVMGIDVGAKLHVVIRGRLNDRWYLLEALTAETFEELEDCFQCYHIECCVVDALPETREARRFQKAHMGTVWLAQYTHQGLEPDWSYDSWLVKAPRTVILDETLQRFREGVYVLPADVRALADGEYFRHLQAPVRTIELDAWGQQFAVYRHRKPDDFAHAEVYATLATIRASLSEGWIATIQERGSGPQLVMLERSDYADR